MPTVCCSAGGIAVAACEEPTAACDEPTAASEEPTAACEEPTAACREAAGSVPVPAASGFLFTSPESNFLLRVEPLGSGRVSLGFLAAGS